MSQALISVLVAVIGSGGLVGGIVAFLKLRPERDSIVVTAAQGALLMQTGIADQLRADLAAAEQRVRALEGRLSARDEQIADLEQRLRVAAGREHGPKL